MSQAVNMVNVTDFISESNIDFHQKTSIALPLAPYFNINMGHIIYIDHLVGVFYWTKKIKDNKLQKGKSMWGVRPIKCWLKLPQTINEKYDDIRYFTN